LAACGSAAAAPALGDPPSAAAGGRGSLGVVIHSFMVRTAGDRGRRGADRFADPARFLEDARALGARRGPVGLGARDHAEAESLRHRAEAAAMYLEGIIALPRGDADLARFEAEVRTARRAGVEVVRTVMLSGRRYETFSSAAAFRRFAEAS